MSMFRTLLEQMKTPTYTEVLYLESTGTQYIDTLFPATINTKIDIDFQYTGSTINGKTRIFGSRKDWNLNGFYAGTASNAMSRAYWFLVGDIVNDRWHQASENSNTDRHNLVLSKAGAYLDSTNIWVPDDVVESFPAFATIALFGAYEGNGSSTPSIEKGVVRIYKCKIYDNDVLVRDLIPVLDENNVPCMFDKLNKQFYYNKGTGTFVYQAINLISYIQATGLEQIDTGYIPNADTQIDITFMLPSTLNERSVFAAKWDLNGFVLMDYGSGLRWHNNTSTWYNFNYYELNQRPRTLTIYQNIIDVDGSNIVTGTYSSITYTNTIKLFAFSNQHQSGCRMYEYKISENGTVLHDFVPALDNNVPCLYDKIGKQFYYNIGGGTFLYG